MGQYHRIINVTKLETFTIGGAKLVEKVSEATAAAFLLLLSNSNGRGGGDFTVERRYSRKQDMYYDLNKKEQLQQDAIHYLQGRWVGDRLVVQGDYAKESDECFVTDKEKSSLVDITDKLETALSEYFD